MTVLVFTLAVLGGPLTGTMIEIFRQRSLAGFIVLLLSRGQDLSSQGYLIERRENSVITLHM